MALQDSTNPMQGVSGPGSFSKRTDLEYQSPEYGAGVEYAAQKAGALLASTPDVRGATNTAVRDAASKAAQSAPQDALTLLYAPSNRPNEPITHGIDVPGSAGGGSNVLAMGKATEKLSDILAKMLPFDTDGSIAVMYQNALARGN